MGALAHAEPFVVAGDKGIVELDEHGAVVRTISKHAAHAPRWSKDHKRIYYLADNTLRAVGLDGKRDTLFAKLPASVTVCASDEQAEYDKAVSELDVQSDEDFVVDGKTACLSLKDRNENMADVDLHVRIDLATHRVKSGLTIPDTCGTSPCDPWRSAKEKRDEPPAAAFEIADHHVMHDGKPVLDVGDFGGADFSPSGRWQLIHGNEEDNDYIYFDVLLLDRTDGALYSIREKKLHKLGVAERKRVKNGKVDTETMNPETAIFWIGERLVFGKSLIDPVAHTRTVLPGDVIR